MAFYTYRFEVVDLEGNVDLAAGAASFDTDVPLAHIERGAQIRLPMKPLPRGHKRDYWVVRVLSEPETTGYDITRQRIFVQVRPVVPDED